MRFFLSNVAVEEINEYFRENMYIFMELPILEVCSMIITHFRILSWAIPYVLDFVMVSLMGYRKHTPMMYIIDGFVFKLRNDACHIPKDGILKKTIVLVIESIEPMDSLVDSQTTFNIQKKLGDGSYSVVYYLANFQKDGESPPSNYAMKFFNDLESGPVDFDAETAILSVLREDDGVINADFLVEIYVLGKTCFAYGMPYFQNGTLYEYAKRLSEGEILKMIGPLTKTMETFHTKRVFHSDIKGENILVNDGGNPFFADFGIAEKGNSNNWIIDVESVKYTQWWRDPWNFLQETQRCPKFKVSILSERWALLLSILDCLSRREYRTQQTFGVFRNGNYFRFDSQKLINDAIDLVFSSSSVKEPCSRFFKKWLDIERFMNLTTTIPKDHPTFLDDQNREFSHDFGLVIDAMNRQANLQPSKTESSDDDSDDD